MFSSTAEKGEPGNETQITSLCTIDAQLKDVRLRSKARQSLNWIWIHSENNYFYSLSNLARAICSESETI